MTQKWTFNDYVRSLQQVEKLDGWTGPSGISRVVRDHERELLLAYEAWRGGHFPSKLPASRRNSVNRFLAQREEQDAND